MTDTTAGDDADDGDALEFQGETPEQYAARRAAELVDIGVILSSPQGRRFMWRVLFECGYRPGWLVAPQFVFDSPEATAVNFGGFNLGQWILAELRAANPDLVDLMEKENRP